jgi:hypothetical protein
MKVISVRLDEPTYELLRQRADETGIPPAVLARSWIRAELSSVREPLVPEIHGELAGQHREPGPLSRAERLLEEERQKKGSDS